ncbi:phage portal protein [Cryptosporangium sp. NPDC051539]|uniref:phage portal protein n=1 Tax=Cryptosporangium sp. NPDC051539 TaxID=3363962 RepID=UPI0037A273A8
MSVFFRSSPALQRQWLPDPPLVNPPSMLSSFANALPRTPQAGLQKVAIWASVVLISSLGSTLPLQHYRGEGDHAKQLPLTPFLEDPSGEGYGASDWLQQMFFALLLAGNVTGDVLARGGPSGLPTQILLLAPGDAIGWRDPQDGKVTWRVHGKERPAANIWHRRAYPMSGQVMGLSPIEQHALTIGQGLSAARYGAQWFTDGAHPSALLTNDEAQLNRGQALEAKLRFLQALRGRREPVVFGRGWKYQAIQVSAEESQFLQTQGYTSAECARIYGPGMPEVLGYETGGTLTYQNREQRVLDLLAYTLDPWLARAERWLSALLPAGEYVRFERAALLRTSTLDRYRAHALALANRWLTVNEVRAIEDQPPVPWGDQPNEPKATTPPGTGAPEKDEG